MSETLNNIYVLSFNDPDNPRAGTSYVKADSLGLVIGASGSVNFSIDNIAYSGINTEVRRRVTSTFLDNKPIGTSVLGGIKHTVCSHFGLIGGGSFNSISGVHTSVVGGVSNRAHCNCSSIVGGCQNIVCGNFSFIGGGGRNCTCGVSAIIGGGGGNSACGTFSTIGGGGLNCACGVAATVGGGCGNCAAGNF